MPPYVRVDRGDRRHHGGPRRNQTPHGRRRPAIPLLALEPVDEGTSERARRPDPKHDRQTSDLIFQGHSLPDQLLARR